MTGIRSKHFIMAPRRQRGVATLFVTLVILAILTLVILLSANVGLFEQKVATNDNRGRMVEQAAEYAVNLSGEYLKANRNVLLSKTTNGWLAADATLGKRWYRCALVAGYPNIPNLADGSPHPCMAERDTTTSTAYPNGRRYELYFYSSDGTDGTGSPSTATATVTDVPYKNLMPANAKLETAGVGVGGTAQFAVTTKVRALLCRFDTSLPTPACRASPVSGNRIAVVLIGDAALPNENAKATIKETWASYSANSAAASVPFIGAGTFNGAGTVTIATAPNAGGYGIPGSIWTPADAQVETTTGGGNFSLESCYIGDFMRNSTGEKDIADAKSQCPNNGSAPPCHCPQAQADSDYWLSGHAAGNNHRENIDVLDRDGSACKAGSPCPPDIQFFPGGGPSDPKVPASALAPLDVAGVLNDDSLFEWIFGLNYVVADRDPNGITLGTNSTTCSKGAGVNCFDYAVRNDLGLDPANILGNCNTLDGSSSGLYYITGPCSITGTVGSATSPAILIVTGDGSFGPNAKFFGMLFIHRDNIAAELSDGPHYTLDMNGGTVFGSIVVEGDISVAGNPVVIYDDTLIDNDPNKFPPSAVFARVAGSWLDSSTGL